MFRKLVVVFGVIEALFPEQVVAALGKLGYRTEGETEPRSWLVSAARLEGILLATAGAVGIVSQRYGRKQVPAEETEEAEEAEAAEVEAEEETEAEEADEEVEEPEE